jgi:hypothetical protein
MSYFSDDSLYQETRILNCLEFNDCYNLIVTVIGGRVYNSPVQGSKQLLDVLKEIVVRNQLQDNHDIPCRVGLYFKNKEDALKFKLTWS